MTKPFGSTTRIVIPEKQLLQSCRILFGPETDITPQFLGYLQPAGVKTAYRKLVMETHPDRAYFIGVQEAILEERFKEVHRAYEEVAAYINEPERYILTMPSGPRYRPRRAAAPASYPRPHFYQSHFHQGQIPSRKIFIGQFLYYSGVISLRQMWDAVVWQKMQRPRLGDIARQLRWLNTLEIQHLLRQRQRGELFGELALRTGVLSSYQVLVLRGRQKSLQPRIGNYFIEQGILLPGKLNTLEAALKEHNRQHWFKRG
jgi:hypothetical protein